MTGSGSGVIALPIPILILPPAAGRPHPEPEPQIPAVHRSNSAAKELSAATTTSTEGGARVMSWGRREATACAV